MPESSDVATKETADHAPAPLSKVAVTKVPEITDKQEAQNDTGEVHVITPIATPGQNAGGDVICFHRNIDEITETRQGYFTADKSGNNAQLGIPFEEIRVTGFRCRDCGKEFYFD